MRNTSSRTALLASLMFVAFFSSIPAGALTLRPVNWREVRALADCVVLANVATLQSEPCVESGSRGVQTRMTLADIEVLAGQPSRGLSVLLPGGTLEGLRVTIPGAPRFTPGERVVLLLRKISDKEFALCGHGMGVLRASADSTLFRPDIPVSDGIPASGATLAEISLHLSGAAGKSGGAATESAKCEFPSLIMVLAAAAMPFAMIWLKRRKSRAAFIALAFVGSIIAGATMSSRPQAASPAPREFVLEGVRWFLEKQHPGQLENGRVLWFRGKGTTHHADDDTFAVISAQFQQWENLPDSAIAFRQEGRTIESGSAISGRNVVSFLQNPPRSAFDKLTLAVTFIQSFQDSEEIEDADIVFNDRDIDWALTDGAESIGSVGLHEIGHFLGLDHTSDPATVMFPIAQGLTTLSTGDIRGAATLYPVVLTPFAAGFASPVRGVAPLSVSFSSQGSQLADGSAPILLWDFGDGTPQSSDPNPVHTYDAPGFFTARLTVSDALGLSSSAEVGIDVVQSAGSINVPKFAFAASLIENSLAPGVDKLAFTVAGADFSPGDRFKIKLGNVTLGSTGSFQSVGFFELDDALSFKGATNRGGIAAIRFDPKKHVLTLALTRAHLGRALDPRAHDSLAQSSSAVLPLQIIVERHSGCTELLSANAAFSFTIRTGRAPIGTVERTIQAKK